MTVQTGLGRLWSLPIAWVMMSVPGPSGGEAESVAAAGVYELSGGHITPAAGVGVTASRDQSRTNSCVHPAKRAGAARRRNRVPPWTDDSEPRQGILNERSSDMDVPPGQGAFRVRVMARGEVSVRLDPFLSPVRPIIED